MNERVKVVLLDDHTLFAKGLAELLELSGSIHVAGIMSNLQDAQALLQNTCPDVIILDLNMPPLDGISLLVKWREGGLATPVLILTVSDSQEDLANALGAGARGYLLKNMEPHEVIDAIHRAARGETVIAPVMTAKLVDLLDRKGGSQASGLALLTQREREILYHLARGLSNKAIARALDISHDTVKFHITHVLSKLNLSSRVEAAVFAVEHKLTQTGSARERKML